MIRFFDLLLSFFGLLILSPVLIIISLFNLLSGPIIFSQVRVGKAGKEFRILKFRSMRVNTESQGQLTVGPDNRITRFGSFLRRYKLDEIPQLWNVLKGEMSMVGPRPEVPRYIALYTQEQRKVLSVKPGITDLASLEFIDENRRLSESSDPEKTYIEEIMPKKIEMNMVFISNNSLGQYFEIILKTLSAVL